jgi:uncharacterized membrane protein
MEQQDLTAQPPQTPRMGVGRFLQSQQNQQSQQDQMDDEPQTLVSPRSVPVLSGSGGPGAPSVANGAGAPPAWAPPQPAQPPLGGTGGAAGAMDMMEMTDQFTAVRLPGPGHQPPLPVGGPPSQPSVEESVDVEYPAFEDDEEFPHTAGSGGGQGAGAVQSWPLPQGATPPDDTVELPGGAVAAAGAAGAVGAAAGAAAQSVPPLSPTPVAPGMPSHVPWEAAHSWGTTTITFSANTAAGLSYLFGWLSGIFFYFGEHRNRYVRFHAMQSILLTGILTAVAAITAVAVLLLVLANQSTLTVLGVALAVIVGLALLALWLVPMVAAFTGHYLLLPLVGQFAERWSAPVREPNTP